MGSRFPADNTDGPLISLAVQFQLFAMLFTISVYFHGLRWRRTRAKTVQIIQFGHQVLHQVIFGESPLVEHLKYQRQQSINIRRNLFQLDSESIAICRSTSSALQPHTFRYHTSVDTYKQSCFMIIQRQLHQLHSAIIATVATICTAQLMLFFKEQSSTISSLFANNHCVLKSQSFCCHIGFWGTKKTRSQMFSLPCDTEGIDTRSLRHFHPSACRYKTGKNCVRTSK